MRVLARAGTPLDWKRPLPAGPSETKAHWPRSAKLEIDGEVAVQADFEGPFRQPFLTSTEAKGARLELAEGSVDH